MSDSAKLVRGPLADLAAEVTVSAPVLLVQGFRAYERYQVTTHVGEPPHSRDVLRAGPVVAILAVDLRRDELVLLRQFRLAAHMVNATGDMVEVVAGRVEPGEEAVSAARREVLEEIGVPPDALVELFSYLPAPGIADEYVTFFLSSVDALKVPARAGVAEEREDIRPMRVSIDDAIAAAGQATLHNGLTMVGLQWLALNRGRLGDILRTGSVAR